MKGNRRSHTAPVRFFYESRHLFSLDENGKARPPKGRAGSSSSCRCEDCDIRGALNAVGLPRFCAECKSARAKGKRRCVIERCANGCEVCGGTGRVLR